MNKYKLQVRHHSQVFDSRESALTYITDTFKYDSLIGEPAIFLYNGQKAQNINTILAFGAGDKKLALIDIANVEEKVAKLESNSSLTQEDLTETSNILMSAIEACGLKFDDNKINDKVSYEPNIKDEVLREAQSVTEALALLSQYTQEHVKDKNITTKDTKTVTLSYVPFSDGMELSANVNISLYGDSDDSDFNNNIIGVKNDGIYATSNLEYDAVKNTLTFTSSGMKNGVFHDDANKKVIELGEHSVYTESNDGHNIQLVITKVDEAHSLISADVKISEDKNNILTTKDNKLFVDGVASNIKYQESNVAAELDAHKNQLTTLSNELQEVVDGSVIKGVETDTAIVEATKGVTNEGYIIKSTVRLSEDNSIQIANGGLSANVNVIVDKFNNKLMLHVGNRIIEQELPGINLVDNIVYDQTNKDIIITFDNNNTATISVKDLFNDYTFYKLNGAPVVIEHTENSNGSINIDARLNLRSTDNILDIENGYLYAPKSLIDSEIEKEKVRAEKAEQTLTTAVENLNTTITTNKTALDNEVARAQLKETEIEGVIAEHKTLVSNELKSISDTVSAEEKRALAAEKVLTDQISTLNGSILHATEDAVQRANAYTNEVALTKADGATYLTSTLAEQTYLKKDKAVSGREDNALKLDEANGGLFVSNKSSEILTEWNVNGAIENWSVNDAISALKTSVDELAKNNSNNEDGASSAEVAALQARVSVLENTVNQYNTQIQTLTNRIATLETQIAQPQKTDADVAKALSVLTQVDENVFTDGQETLDEVLTKQKLVVDSGDY